MEKSCLRGKEGYSTRSRVSLSENLFGRKLTPLTLTFALTTALAHALTTVKFGK